MWVQVQDRDKRVVAGELVLRPAALLGAALSCLRNTGLYMAARLGTTCKEVMNDHSMWNMALVQLLPPCPISDSTPLMVSVFKSRNHPVRNA